MRVEWYIYIYTEVQKTAMYNTTFLRPPVSVFRSSRVPAARRNVLSNAYVMFLSCLLKVMLIFDVGFFSVLYILCSVVFLSAFLLPCLFDLMFFLSSY